MLQRKVLALAAAASLAELAFQAHYELLAQPFEWKFTLTDPAKLLERLALEDSGRLREAA